jgi:two-component system sensor histidine kinase AdeS
MSAVVLSVTLLAIVSTYVFYAVMFTLNPSFYIENSWIPTGPEWLFPSGPEWIWITSITLIGLLIATYAAGRLTKRILTPLNSVVDSVRKVAQGDLSVRAEAGDASSGEASWLVNDFNSMAERLERMAAERSVWNASIAHELRTPVTILRGRLQGLAEGVFAADEVQFRNLLTQVEGLSRLIEDLRTLSLADSGHLELRWDFIDLSAEIESLAQLLEPDLKAAGFSLALDLVTEPVFCDPARLRQALIALLDNARRYAQPGQICVTTRVFDDAYLVLVEDEGPGVPEELAARIFDAFQRGKNARSCQTGGSGLGLAVVRAIAQAHGGKAVCRPGLKGGALFQICLPR